MILPKLDKALKVIKVVGPIGGICALAAFLYGEGKKNGQEELTSWVKENNFVMVSDGEDDFVIRKESVTEL